MRYRIVKYINPYYTAFKIQKKSFLGFWYNFNNIDGILTGYYNTEAEAREAIERHRSDTKVTIIKVEGE